MSENRKTGFRLDPKAGYFKNGGVNVMAFDDIYPEGHQSGVSILMHGKRVATNGDVRYEPTPGQWQPVPKQKERTPDAAANAITTTLSFPDMDRHLKGFNPMIYPDFAFSYTVTVRGAGDAVEVTVDLAEPVPEALAGVLSFNLELFPGFLFDKPWIMDGKQGIFPRQPNGPTLSREPNYLRSLGLPAPENGIDPEILSGGNKGYNPIVADDLVSLPYAEGKRFISRPDDPLLRFTVESETAPLKLYDGRMNHNNGWFVLASEIPAGVTKGAVRWRITPHVVDGWIAPPVVQVSQVGYHPGQPKIAVVELDDRDEKREKAVLFRIGENGEEKIAELSPEEWGKFLRYQYLRFDFTDVREEGLYRIRYAGSETEIFRIARDVYDRGVWQPVLEYFLPVQMCHMRVSEKYRVWHDLCHADDARMAPVNYNHIDGYRQGPSTLTKYAPGDHVPGLDHGGWHDAGDYDLRIESQAGECYILTLAYECFGVDYDVTAIDQTTRTTEIHQPDGKNDILQQIEHGLLSVVGAYKSLGRLYRGIICGDLRQYVLLGDSAAMTDGIPGNADDRWVFTEDNPFREFTAASELAASARAMRGFNDGLAADALRAAEEIFENTEVRDRALFGKIQAAVELFLTTGDGKYRDFLLAEKDVIVQNVRWLGWIACRAVRALDDEAFTADLRQAMEEVKKDYESQSAETPYGIPYKPYIWGAGWGIQSLGFRYYFLHEAFPDLFGPELCWNALNFVLGCHPGSNTMSFASGVGARSAIVGYGLNRADWSYIPGGVVSGTALIRPDFPELLEFPYLWQQVEYVMGGGSSHYMFLVLAAKKLLEEKE